MKEQNLLCKADQAIGGFHGQKRGHQVEPGKLGEAKLEIRHGCVRNLETQGFGRVSC